MAIYSIKLDTHEERLSLIKFFEENGFYQHPDHFSERKKGYRELLITDYPYVLLYTNKGQLSPAMVPVDLKALRLKKTDSVKTFFDLIRKHKKYKGKPNQVICNGRIVTEEMLDNSMSIQ